MLQVRVLATTEACVHLGIDRIAVYKLGNALYSEKWCAIVHTMLSHESGHKLTL